MQIEGIMKNVCRHVGKDLLRENGREGEKCGARERERGREGGRERERESERGGREAVHRERRIVHIQRECRP